MRILYVTAKGATAEYFLKARILGKGSISGINTDRCHATHTPAEMQNLRIDIGLPQTRYTVGFVGRLNKRTLRPVEADHR